MKCTCGCERAECSVLCRMLEVTRERFLVRIYDANNRLLSQSAECLGIDKALEFVRRVVNLQCNPAHFHWERPLLAALGGGPETGVA
jgi:hypothetical protein